MSRNHKLLVAALIVVAVAGAVGFLIRDDIYHWLFRPTETTVEQGLQTTNSTDKGDIETVASDLTIPWAVSFLPDGDMLVTERDGTLRRIGNNQSYTIDGVEHAGEGGLLGLALHPDFEQNKLLYLYLTTETSNGLINRIERYRFTDNQLTDKSIIIDNIPGANYHDGGRIAFGPDGLLYATTGDAGNDVAAQDTSSLSGKILRLTADGDIPSDNPFSNEVYSYGHRNPQGLAWDDEDQLWSTEHGRSGLRTGFDELNKIKAGANYGWPEIEGGQTRDGMVTPVLHSGPEGTWAPASLAYQNGSLYFGGLRGQSLYEVRNLDSNPTLVAHLRQEFGRIREVTVGPASDLYITTSNRDGRGQPSQADDKIIRIIPDVLRAGIFSE